VSDVTHSYVSSAAAGSGAVQMPVGMSVRDGTVLAAADVRADSCNGWALPADVVTWLRRLVPPDNHGGAGELAGRRNLLLHRVQELLRKEDYDGARRGVKGGGDVGK